MTTQELPPPLAEADPHAAYERLKAIYRDENPDSTPEQYEGYCRELADELRI